MKYEKVLGKLKSKNFQIQTLDFIQDHNMQYWNDGQRAVVIKEYRTESIFLDWLKEDQVIIGELYKLLDSKFKNNLYYFMVIDFETTSLEVRLEINKAEKNHFICKKYILTSEEDLEKIPFLINKFGNKKDFRFDERFRLYMLEESRDKLEGSSKSQNINSTEAILNFYFDEYIEKEDNTLLLINKLNKGEIIDN